MLDNAYTKTSLYLAISLFCLMGVIVPIPLAPITFSLSAGVLLLARESYIRVIEEGQADLLRVKLALTMAICFGNMLATAMMVALIGFAFYITFSNPQLFKDLPTAPRSPEIKIPEMKSAEKQSSEVSTKIHFKQFYPANHYYFK